MNENKVGNGQRTPDAGRTLDALLDSGGLQNFIEKRHSATSRSGVFNI